MGDPKPTTLGALLDALGIGVTREQMDALRGEVVPPPGSPPAEQGQLEERVARLSQQVHALQQERRELERKLGKVIGGLSVAVAHKREDGPRPDKLVQHLEEQEPVAWRIVQRSAFAGPSTVTDDPRMKAVWLAAGHEVEPLFTRSGAQ